MRIKHTPASRRPPLADGEYWCLFPKDADEPPTLLIDPGPWFEGNAEKNGDRIAKVRLVEITAEPDGEPK
jgi:hypothetical protein